MADPGDESDECWLVMFVGNVLQVGSTIQGCDEVGASVAVASGELAAATITQIEEDQPTHVELYDLGATHHISPYQNDFTTYSEFVTLLFLKAANGQQFPAIGSGNMVVSTPNGNGHSKLTLENVLHVPSVSYMLVSLGALDSLGYCIAISGGHLDIQSSTSDCVAHIVRTAHRLY